MQGLPDPPCQRGIIPRAFEHVFESVQVWMGLTWEEVRLSVTDGPQGTYGRGMDCGLQSEPGPDSAWVNRGKSWVLKRSWVKNKTKESVGCVFFSCCL